jgi:hypothetical protein
MCIKGPQPRDRTGWRPGVNPAPILLLIILKPSPSQIVSSIVSLDSRRHQYAMQPPTTLQEPPTISLPYKWPFSDPSDRHLLLTRRSHTGTDASDVSFTGEARYKGDSFTSEVSVTFAAKDRDSKLWPHGLHVESVQVAMPESLSVEGSMPDDESAYHCESGCVYDLPHRSVEASVKAVYGRDERGRHSTCDRCLKGHKTQVVSLQERLIVQPGTKIDFVSAEPQTYSTCAHL